MTYTVTATNPTTGKTKVYVDITEVAADIWSSWHAGRGWKVSIVTDAGAKVESFDTERKVARVAKLAAELMTLSVRKLRAMVKGAFNYKPLRKAAIALRLAELA
jgi:hypothetical protein